MVSTGIGSWPGAELADALKIAFAECPDLPYLPELPERGPHAGLIGRGTALLAGIGVDLHPRAGDSPTARPVIIAARSRPCARTSTSSRRSPRATRDRSRSPSQVRGHWPPVLEHPRGDKVLPDAGARRDVGQSLAQGIGDLRDELARRLPELTVIIQLDEPSLPAVLAGGIATASGLGRHRPSTSPRSHRLQPASSSASATPR